MPGSGLRHEGPGRFFFIFYSGRTRLLCSGRPVTQNSSTYSLERSFFYNQSTKS